MNRNAMVDVSRAIAVMLVITYHIWRDTGRPSYPLGGGFDLFGFMGNGWIGVGIFFVISGYCMGISTSREFSRGVSINGYLKYVAKRFLRIAPPYYAAILFWVLIINTYGIAEKGTSYYDIITHLTFTHNITPSTMFSISGVFWTIAVEMQFYLLLPFLLVLMRSHSHCYLLFFFSLMISLVTFYSDVSSVYKWGLPVYLPLFIFGYILNVSNYLSVKVNDYKLIYILLPMFVILLSYEGSGYDNNIRTYELIASIIFGLLMTKMISMNWNGVIVRMFSFIGSASFSIYLYNYIYMAVKPSTGFNIISSIVMWMSVIAFGTFMYFVIERQTEKIRKKIFARKASIESRNQDGLLRASERKEAL